MEAESPLSRCGGVAGVVCTHVPGQRGICPSSLSFICIRRAAVLWSTCGTDGLAVAAVKICVQLKVVRAHSGRARSHLADVSYPNWEEEKFSAELSNGYVS